MNNLTLGLEIHAELKTKTKMFCDCLNDFEEHHPNVNICPICVGHPGTLPTINKKAAENVIKVGLALEGKVFPYQKTKFDRKNYFYPDLPKGYQMSQYNEPLVLGGRLFNVRIRRIHLEEDTGTLAHSNKYSLVDYNRSGIPLMELVTEPDITSAKQAVDFAKQLKLLIRYLEVSDADMEKGQLRLEANISINMGTKVEIKNINSFKALEDAIHYEYKRQGELLSKNKKIVQETRGWSDTKQSTISQRNKEDAHDYRYFSEPDLPVLTTAAFDVNQLKLEIPELPLEKLKRFIGEFNLSENQAETLIQDRYIANYFEKTASELENKKQALLLYNYFTSDIWGLMKKNEISINDIKISPVNLAHLIDLIDKREISSRIAKELIVKMFKTGSDPHLIIKEEKWQQVSDLESLKPLIEKVIKANPKAVEDFKAGKITSLQFLIGKAMGELKGRGNPQILKNILEELLK